MTNGIWLADKIMWWKKLGEIIFRGPILSMMDLFSWEWQRDMLFLSLLPVTDTCASLKSPADVWVYTSSWWWPLRSCISSVQTWEQTAYRSKKQLEKTVRSLASSLDYDFLKSWKWEIRQKWRLNDELKIWQHAARGNITLWAKSRLESGYCERQGLIFVQITVHFRKRSPYWSTQSKQLLLWWNGRPPSTAHDGRNCTVGHAGQRKIRAKDQPAETKEIRFTHTMLNMFLDHILW